MLDFFPSKFVSKELIGRDTYECTFKVDGTFDYKAGQYVWVILPRLDVADPRGDRRAFSVASSQKEKGKFSIILRAGISGYKKTLLDLAENDEVQVRGPMGSSFVIEESSPDKICLIGGGVGAAPFISILRSYDLLTKKPKVTFIDVNSNQEKKFLTDELSAICKKNSLSFIDMTGKFDEKKIGSTANDKDFSYFICGTQGFVDDVYKKLTSLGMSSVDMHFEEFYPAAARPLDPMEGVKHKTGYELAVESSSNHIIITDTNGTILFANEAASKVTGYANSEMIGQTPRLWGGQMSPDYYKNMWASKKSGKSFSGEFTNIRKDGTHYVAFARISPIFNDTGAIVGYVGTEEDITKAKEIDKMKSDFISLASHQLRTPLSAMKWLLEMILGGDTGILTNKQLEFVKNIDQSNQRMITLVDQLLNISRIESGRLTVEPVLTNLKELVVKIVAEMKPKSDEKKIEISCEMDANLPSINVDPKLVSEVYRNLLDNSVKYTPDGGSIRVLVGVNSQSVVTQVIDNGIGIPVRQKPRIFDRFFRADNATRAETEGTGLGLYLAKDIVQASGGRIWFESTEGKGTTFYFSLPLTGSSSKKGTVVLS